MFSKFSTDAIAGGSRMLRTAYGHYDIELTFTGNNRFACWNPSCKYPSYYTARFKIRDWSWDWPRGYARILQHKGKRQQKEQHTWQPYTQHGTQTMKTVVMSVQARYQVDGASERQVHSTPESQSREVQRHPGMRMRVRIVFRSDHDVTKCVYISDISCFAGVVSVSCQPRVRVRVYEWRQMERQLFWLLFIFAAVNGGNILSLRLPTGNSNLYVTTLHALPIVSIAIWHI